MIQCCGNEYPDEDIDLHRMSMLHKKIHGKSKPPDIFDVSLEWIIGQEAYLDRYKDE